MWKQIRNIVFMAAFIVMMTVVPVCAYYSVGDTGSDVYLIQKQLCSRGYPVKVDGVYSKDTAKAVVKFQKNKKIQVSGNVGAWTFYQLTGKRMNTVNVDRPQYSGFSSDGVGHKLVAIADQYVGVPYVWGGNTPKGFDCSGFTKYVFSNAGISLPRLADEQYRMGATVTRQNLIPGDLVFFTTYCPGVSHTGIYVGNDQFISATSSSGIHIDSLSSNYWSSRYIGAKRVR